MRIAEIMTDFRNIQNYIASIRASPSAEEYNEEGFVVLRHCESLARILLAQPFQAINGNPRDDDQRKMQLRRILVDACVRRHRAQKIYLQATAALRWVNSRAALLQNQRAHAGHAPGLQQISQNLRTELASVTDARIELSLRTSDINARKWVQEDPPLAVIQRVLMATGGDTGGSSSNGSR